MSNQAAFTITDPWTASARIPAADGRGGFGARRTGINLAEADALLTDAKAAELRARVILKSNTGDPIALYLLGASLRRQGRDEAAKAILESLVAAQSQMGPAWRELGLLLQKCGDRENAMAALLRALDFHYLDGDILFALGDLIDFRTATPGREPEEARNAKDRADLLVRQGNGSGAASLYERSLELAADFPAARFRYATLLLSQGRFESAREHLQNLLLARPDCTLIRSLSAVALAGSGQNDAAIREFDSFIDSCADKPGLWLEYGKALHSSRDHRSAAAMQRAIRMLPSFVEAYVLYANIKPFVWDPWMIEMVRGQLARPDLAAEDRALLHFCLGKAFEDAGRYAESFENYRACNEILRRDDSRPARASAHFVRRTAAVFSPALLRKRAGAGYPAHDPIFIVGMKRSGSTLVEQILSRHSAIEPLGELEELTQIVGRISSYPAALKDIDPGALYAMGKEYMTLTAARRKLGKPFFTDKLPHNFGRVGLIHLMLPNARIIDVRRHPLDCGFSCYKHYFPGGQISLSLSDFGSGYVDYVWLMAHFDRILPGKVHRIHYERLVANFEDEVRRLLAYLGLPFEQECLRFHEDSRAVLTPSVDQVRTPLYNSAVDYWRHYEKWLDPMKEKLGCVLGLYPDVPAFFDEIHVRLRRPLSLGEAGGPFRHVRGLRAQRIDLPGPAT